MDGIPTAGYTWQSQGRHGHAQFVIGAGREEYLRQQKRVLSSGTHLVEIDLLRVGELTLACPKEKLPVPYHYLEYINRAAEGWAVYCIPCSPAGPASTFPCISSTLILSSPLPRCPSR